MTHTHAASIRLLGLALAATLSVVPTWSASAVGTTPEETVPVGGWPLLPPPAVEAGFDPPDDPWGAGHRGVDLLGSPAQSVRAALPGEVTFAGVLAGRGVVVVDHGDTRTTYEPVTTVASVGDRVSAGAVIGRLDLNGSHCFPRACLHWGWRRGETYLDPLLLVGAGAVRLLPLWRAEPVGPGLMVAAPPVALPYAGWRPTLKLVGLRREGAPAGRPVAAGPW